jgi:hypothetical protein
VAAGRSAVDAKLVLDRNDLDVVDIEEVSRAAIGIEFLFVNLEPYSRWIVIAFRAIINRAHHALTFREFRSNGFADVGGKSGNAALTRKMIAEEGYLLDDRGIFHGPACDRLLTFLPGGDDSICASKSRRDKNIMQCS